MNEATYKQGVKRGVEMAISELVSASHIPQIIVDGFLVRLNQVFSENLVQPAGPLGAKDGKERKA